MKRKPNSNVLLPPDGGSYIAENGRLTRVEGSLTRPHPGKSRIAIEAAAAMAAPAAGEEPARPAANAKSKR